MSMLKQATSVTKIANGCDESNQEHGDRAVPRAPRREKLSMDLMNLIRKQVELRMTALEHGRSYTLKQICGEEFWSQLETTMH